jgi:hypothetical protein
MNLNFFKRASKRDPQLKQPTHVESTSMRLSEWRENPALVASAQALFKNPTFKLIRQILDNENPCHNVLPLGINPNDRIVHGARIEGSVMILSDLDAFAKHSPKRSQLLATFEPEAQEKKR